MLIRTKLPPRFAAESPEVVALESPRSEAGELEQLSAEARARASRRALTASVFVLCGAAVGAGASLSRPTAHRTISAAAAAVSAAAAGKRATLSVDGATFAGPSRGKGCSNWRDIELIRRVEPTVAECAARCAATAGCEGFGYQMLPNGACGHDHDDDSGSSQFSCVMWFDTCQEMNNSCFDNYAVQTPELEVEWISTGCPSKKPGDQYVVAAIFAGRREFMHILVSYVDKLVEDCLLDEAHIWDFTRDSTDADWLRKIVADRPAYKFIKPEGDTYWNPAYHYYAAIGGAPPQFTPIWSGATRSQTVIVKIDDDVVYLNTSSFASFTDYVLSHREKFLVFANTVNNGVSAYYQAHHIERLGKRHPSLLQYPSDADDPDRAEGTPVTPGRYGTLLRDSNMSMDVHRDFLAHMEDYSWEDPQTGSCIIFGTNATDSGQGRFSINVFGTTWESWDTVDKLVTDDFATNTMPEDERVLTVDATEQGLQECLFTPFTVSHWSFGCQKHPQELLHRYEDLLEGGGAGDRREEKPAEDHGVLTEGAGDHREGQSAEGYAVLIKFPVAPLKEIHH